MSDEKTEKNPRKEMLYPHNVLEAFGNGCLLDLRVRMAVNLLQHSPIFEGVAVAAAGAEIRGVKDAWSRMPVDVAGAALAIADEILRLGEEAGMVKPLPDDDEISVAVKRQATRTGKFSARQQLAGQKEAQEMASGALAVPGNSIPFNRKPS